MDRLLRAAGAMLAGVILTLACVFALLRAVIAIARITHPALHALAVLGALVFGVLLLLGSVYLSTRIAVNLLTDSRETPRS